VVQVVGGWLDGHRIRRARKAHECSGHELNPDNPHLKGEPCGRTIQPGEYYIEGEFDPSQGGGFATERFCGECHTTGPEAKEALKRAREEAR
jgi:hypothetical protein